MSASEAHQGLTVAHRVARLHPRWWYWPGAPQPPISHEARAPMYTRRIRVAFGRRIAVTAVAFALAGCHSSPNRPAARTPPTPTTVQVGYGTQEKRDVTAAVSSASGEKM